MSSAAFSPDAARIVTASGDGTARVWDAATGAKIALLRGHESRVESAAFSPDGALIVTAGYRTARVWNAATGAEIAALRGRAGQVRSAAFSPDGARIVTVSDDRAARVWDVATGAEIAVLRGHESTVRSAAFSPNGARIVTASNDRTARVWDAATGAEAAVLRGHEDWVLSAAFSPDGARIVTASRDRTARIWESLQATVEMSIRGELAHTAAEPDPWTVITDADFILLTSSRAGFVVRKYREALVGATRQMYDSILRQIRIYTALELFGEVAKEAEAAVDGLAPPTATVPAKDRYLVFTGHRADAQDRAEPRFPNTKAAVGMARHMIHAAVEEERQRTDGRLVGVAGGASGGDLLFHEVCGELGIKTWLLLAVPRDLYVRASVQDGGPDWVDRFDTLYRDREAANRLLVLQNDQTLLSWLADAPDYSVWLRNNLWTFWFGLSNGAQNASLIALWNGKEGDSFGGTKDMVQLAEDHGTRTKILPAEQLLRVKK